MTTRRRRRLAAGAALAVLAVDLVHLALEATPIHHARSAPWLVATPLLAAAILAVAPRVPSTPLAVAAGVAAGGALANFASALIWSAGVPDPLVLGVYAFNIADVAVVVGVCSLVTAAIATAWHNRGRLHEPV